jgi:hypothetical protein
VPGVRRRGPGGSRITPPVASVPFSAARPRARDGSRSHISATQTGPRRGRSGRPRAEPGDSAVSGHSARRFVSVVAGSALQLPVRAAVCSRGVW